MLKLQKEILVVNASISSNTTVTLIVIFGQISKGPIVFFWFMKHFIYLADFVNQLIQPYTVHLYVNICPFVFHPAVLSFDHSNFLCVINIGILRPLSTLCNIGHIFVI